MLCPKNNKIRNAILTRILNFLPSFSILSLFRIKEEERYGTSIKIGEKEKKRVWNFNQNTIDYKSKQKDLKIKYEFSRCITINTRGAIKILYLVEM